MTPKLSRFLHLERARGGRSDETAAPLRDGGRFESLEERKEAHAEAAVPEAHLERFKGDAPLALADNPEETRRFPRCRVCESENGRFAKACGVCGADLETPEQREYNERLWQQRRQGLSRTHADEVEALRQLEARRREEDERFKQQLEQLRREEGGGRWVRIYSQHSTIGTGLLALIPHPLVRWLTLAAVLCLAVGLWRYGAGRTRMAGGAMCLLLLVLFLPGRSARFR